MENKKEAAQKKQIQEQQQYTVQISIANLDEFNNLLSDITGKLNELKNFKLEIKTKG